MLKDLILKNRSYRRFYQNHKIEKSTLIQLIDLARQSPSGRNLQPLKYIISSDDSLNRIIFPHLVWAGYLKDWDGPEEGERPTGYIIILGDKSIKQTFGIDPGIAAQSILLGATELGLGGCIIASIQKEKLSKQLNLDSGFEILLVLALGKPKEKVKIVPLNQANDIKYWRDENGVHYVPKRSMEEIIISLPKIIL